MDPNETLKAIRMCITAADTCDNPFRAADHNAEAVAAFSELDKWLSDGGFLPEDWKW